MTGDRAEIMRSYFAHLARGEEGLDDALALLGDDFVLDYTRSRGPAAGVYRGREGVRRFWLQMLEALEPVELIETEVFEVGDQLVRVGGFRARGRGSGAEIRAVGATVWTFQGDVPVSVVLYQSQEDALADLGN